MIVIFSAKGQDPEVRSGLQRISGGAIWFESRTHGETDDYPTIVFESGALSHSAYWDPVIDPIANFANTIRYDRAGLGRSLAPKDSIRSSVQISNELKELLDSLKVDQRIILVCHSAGGFHGRAFSQGHGDKVHALILIESLCTDWEDMLRSSLSEDQNKERDSLLKINRSRLSLIERQEYKAAELNRIFLDQQPQMKMPVYIIYGTSHNWPEGYNSAVLDQKWKDCQSSLLRISENSHLIKVSNAGHYIFQEFDLPRFIDESLISEH